MEIAARGDRRRHGRAKGQCRSRSYHDVTCKTFTHSHAVWSQTVWCLASAEPLRPRQRSPKLSISRTPPRAQLTIHGLIVHTHRHHQVPGAACIHHHRHACTLADRRRPGASALDCQTYAASHMDMDPCATWSMPSLLEEHAEHGQPSSSYPVPFVFQYTKIRSAGWAPGSLWTVLGSARWRRMVTPTAPRATIALSSQPRGMVAACSM